MKTVADTGSGQALARETVEELQLIAFVREWNTGGGSLIRDFQYFWNAVQYDDRLAERISLALLQAEALGVETEYVAALEILLKHVIETTFRSGLAAACRTWASKIVEEGPILQGAPAPFRNWTEWADWCVASVDWPFIVDPDGGDLLPEKQVEQLLRQALWSKSESAKTCGWFREEAVMLH